MPDLRIPVGRYAKRIFAAVVGGSLLLIVLLRFLLIPAAFGTDAPSAAEVLDDSLGNIFATVFAATVLSGVVLWLIAPARKRTELDIIHPKDVGVVLARALANARSWHYDGSTGRWNRSDVLPGLAAAARRSNSARSCRLVIMDPRNEKLCRTYASFRRGLKSGRNHDWSLETVRVDLCATIASAAFFSHWEPLLDIRLFLKNMSPVFRIDASDQLVVLTREDKAEPALACAADTHFFDAFMETVNFDVRQAEELNLRHAYTGPPTDRDAVRSVLSALEISFDGVEDDDFLDQVLTAATNPVNPYGA